MIPLILLLLTGTSHGGVLKREALSQVYRFRHDTFIPPFNSFNISSINFPSTMAHNNVPFEIDIVSRTLLNFDLYHVQNSYHYKILYESCAPTDAFGIQLIPNNSINQRCIVVRQYNNIILIKTLRFFDRSGSKETNVPWLSDVSRRLVIVMDHTSMQVALDGVFLHQKDAIQWTFDEDEISPTGIAIYAKKFPPAVHFQFKNPYITIHGPGILHSLDVRAHWSTADYILPDIHVSTESARQRRWDWWFKNSTNARNRDAVRFISPLPHQQIIQGTVGYIRISTYLPSNSRWCMSITRQETSQDRMATTCFEAWKHAEELSITTDQIVPSKYKVIVFLHHDPTRILGSVPFDITSSDKGTF
jgi:hypothetical protein